MKVNGHTLPVPQKPWEDLFDEVFFHTSRYFPERLIFLEKLAGKQYPDLHGFHASELNHAQRFVLAWMMRAKMDTRHLRQFLSVLQVFHNQRINNAFPTEC